MISLASWSTFRVQKPRSKRIFNQEVSRFPEPTTTRCGECLPNVYTTAGQPRASLNACRPICRIAYGNFCVSRPAEKLLTYGRTSLRSCGTCSSRMDTCDASVNCSWSIVRRTEGDQAGPSHQP